MPDTIAAIATAPARSAIGILRVSGDRAIALVSSLFRPAGGPPLSAAADRKLIYGTFFDENGAVLDRCLATVSRAPNSYTGEDTAEVQCHGSPLLLSQGLHALLARGARCAQPGEFTRRAFLNGRMDLTQAEAVADLIDAQTAAAARNAAGQLAGAIRGRIEGIYDGLLDLVARFQAILDYPDEDIDDLTEGELGQALQTASQALDRLLSTFQQGKILTEGVPAAIVGRPNVGKSSLLNAILGYERAIVSPLPGTTRDTIEERVLLGGVLLRLTDTAGLRETRDPLERMGTQRSRQALSRADLALVVLDGSAPLTGEDLELIETAAAAPHAIAVVNKADLPRAADLDALSRLISPVCTVSALDGQGLPELAGAVASFYVSHGEVPEGEILTNARQAGAVLRSREAVDAARAELARGMTPDAVLVNVEEALSALGEVTGKTLREDLVERIFSRFCLGK